MDKEKMIEWIGTHNVGVSSKTMWVALMEIPHAPNSSNYDIPHDADDFSRCYSQPMLDFNKTCQNIPQWQRDMARWSNRKEIYASVDFKDYQPRKGFKCGTYFNQNIT